MVETIMVTLTEASTGAIVIISKDALTFLFWDFEDGFKWAWMVFFCLEILLAGGGISINSFCLVRFLVRSCSGAVTVGEGSKLELRTKDEAAMIEVRAG